MPALHWVGVTVQLHVAITSRQVECFATALWATMAYKLSLATVQAAATAVCDMLQGVLA